MPHKVVYEYVKVGPRHTLTIVLAECVGWQTSGENLCSRYSVFYIWTLRRIGETAILINGALEIVVAVWLKIYKVKRKVK
jgi:hypothetical protein